MDADQTADQRRELRAETRRRHALERLQLRAAEALSLPNVQPDDLRTIVEQTITETTTTGATDA